MMRRISVFLTVLVLFAFTACSSIDPAIAYCTRGVVAVSNNIDPKARSFVINYAEYNVDENGKRVVFECIYNYGEMNLVKHMFEVGDGESFRNNPKAVLDEETGLYLVDNGSKEFLKYKEREISTKRIYDNFNKYKKNKDPALLGMPAND